MHPSHRAGPHFTALARSLTGASCRITGPLLIERIYTVLSLTPRPLMLIIAGCGHHLMEARMLRGIKRRAESRR
jgi:hypothetical protein